MIICDLVDINKNYFVKKLEINDCVYEIAEVLKKIDNRYNNTKISNFFLWPPKALRSALEVLLFGSTYKTAIFGINNLFTDGLNEEQKKIVELDFLVNSNNVHLASALDSHYFPYFDGKNYSNQLITSKMGNLLNLYKNCTVDKMLSYVTERQKIIEKKPILPVSLIEVNEYASLNEINDLANKYFSPGYFSSILNHLLSLPSEDIEKKVSEYNSLVEKEINKAKNKSFAIDLSVSLGTDLIGFIPVAGPFVGMALDVLYGIKKRDGSMNLKKFDKIEEALTKIGNGYNEKRAISFLSKINSVARLKKY